MRSAVHSRIRNGVSRYTKPGSIFASLGSKLLLFADPGRLDTVTYTPGAVTTWTGTATTSKHYHTAHNAALNFTNAFTIALEYQPTSFTGQDEYLLSKANPAVANGFFIRHKATGTGTYNLEFFLPGFYAASIAAANFAGGGQIIVCYDGTIATAANRVRIFYNGTEFSAAAGNITPTLTPPATITNNTFGLALGAPSGDYGQLGRCAAIFHRLHIWNTDKWADRAALWNSGSPQPWSSLSSSVRTGGVAAWDFTGTFTGAESSTSYTDAVNGLVMQCRFHASSGSTPGATTATETALIARRIAHPYRTGEGFYAPCGRGPRYYHPSLHTGGSAELFGKAALQFNGFNSTTNSNYAQYWIYDGDEAAVANYLSGDVLIARAITQIGSGAGGTANNENWHLSYMVEASGAASDYWILGYRWNGTNYLPTVRIADPNADPGTADFDTAYNSNYDWTNTPVRPATGDKDLIHCWKEPSGSVLNYRRTNLTTAAVSDGSNPGGQQAAWWGDVGDIKRIVAQGHENSSTQASHLGIIATATGLSAAERTQLSAAIAAQYA